MMQAGSRIVNPSSTNLGTELGIRILTFLSISALTLFGTKIPTNRANIIPLMPKALEAIFPSVTSDKIRKTATVRAVHEIYSFTSIFLQYSCASAINISNVKPPEVKDVIF